MALMLKNARLIDPQIGLDEVADILIRDGKIVEVGTRPRHGEGRRARSYRQDRHSPASWTCTCTSAIRARSRRRTSPLVPVRRPTVVSPRCAPCRTRARWSTTAVAVEYVKARAAAVGKCRVVVAGACSKDLKGEVLSDMGDMYNHGAPVFTDDGHGIQDAGMMRRVMGLRSPVRHRHHGPLPGRLAGGRRPGERGRGEHAPRHGGLAGRGRGARGRPRHRALPLDGLPPAHPAHHHQARPRHGGRRQGRGAAGDLRGDAAPYVPHRGRHHRRVPDLAQGEPAAAHRRGRRRAHRGLEERRHRCHRHRPRAPHRTGRRIASSSWRPSA